jgi:hypothetical protein
MTWFENKKWVWIWNSNHTTLIIQTKHTNFIQDYKLHSELLCKQCSCYSDTRGVTTLSLNWNLNPRFGGVVPTWIVNSQTFSHYDNTKSGWPEWRKSLLSQVASSLVWLLHCILKNLIVLRLVTCPFWSKTLIGCSGYDKLASRGVTSSNTTSTCSFKHFFNCDMWKMSWTPAKDGGRSSW